MIRNVLWLAACLCVAGWVQSALAFGIGDIKLHSVLNQPFNADIDLLSVTEDELDMVRVRLADADAFERVGIERSSNLTLLKFKPTLDEQGKTKIQVSSSSPIREPFLNFIVEFSWPNGRLLREYTVLLDPPVFTERKAPQVATAPANIELTPEWQASEQPTVDSAEPFSAQEHDRIKRGDTLWNIARRVKPDNASIYQTMMAIQQANRNAFIGGNMHLLRQGEILRLPSVEEIRALSQAEALATYRQNTASRKAPVAKKPAVQKIQRQKEEIAEDPSTETEEKAVIAEQTANEKADELHIATARSEPEKGTEKAGSSEDEGDVKTGESLNQDMLLAREDIALSGQEVSAIRGQMETMESQLADMQRLIALKDEQLARLQANNAQRLQEEADAARRQAAQPQSSGSDGVGAILAEPFYLVGIAVLVLLLLIGGLMLWRRHQSAADEQLLAEDGADSSTLTIYDEDQENKAVGQKQPAETSSVAVDGNTYDPLAEAERHLSYGRYHAAEELLQNALHDEPARWDIKYKLLDIYYAMQNATAFAGIAQNMLACDDNLREPEAWQRVTQLGKELQVPMFVEFDSPFTKKENGLTDNDLAVGKVPILEDIDRVEMSKASPVFAGETVTDDSDDWQSDLSLDDSTDQPQLGVPEPMPVAAKSSNDSELTLAPTIEDEMLSDTSVGTLKSNAKSKRAVASQNRVDQPLDIDEAFETLVDDKASTKASHNMADVQTSDSRTQEPEDETVNTKLDLARVYIDMGDLEGARDILDEVCVEGSKNQQSTAQELLAQIS